ncbi:MAG: FtsW/RodA/SpoVE family cell cycle protein [Alphaproteobacteria bacterium]|nr:FtsW/RodA/SpoVE family cell cycle protein [Alphaproteobacteria bacterium]
MLRITRGEDSKLTSWYFEIDRKLLTIILLLVGVGAIMMITAGAAQAAHMRPPQPWFYFIVKAIPAYLVGLSGLFIFSMLNKQQIIKLSVVGALVGIIGLLVTVVHPVMMKGSARWAHIGGFGFMPADVLKPSFIILTAWFLDKMRKTFGENIFLNKQAWRFKWLSWWPYVILFGVCVLIIFRHPDIGTASLYVAVLFAMLLVAGFPLKWLPGVGVLVCVMAMAALSKSHVRERAMDMFTVKPFTQVWYSLNSIRHGGLLGSGEEAYVKDVLPESTNDFIYSAIAEDWGALVACGLVVVLFVLFNMLINHAIHAKDRFVVYAVSGTAALFAGQICFNLMTALHLIINKGMTLPFISYGGISFISFCVLFGMVLALIREDMWNK